MDDKEIADCFHHSFRRDVWLGCDQRQSRARCVRRDACMDLHRWDASSKTIPVSFSIQYRSRGRWLMAVCLIASADAQCNSDRDRADSGSLALRSHDSRDLAFTFSRRMAA